MTTNAPSNDGKVTPADVTVDSQDLAQGTDRFVPSPTRAFTVSCGYTRKVLAVSVSADEAFDWARHWDASRADLTVLSPGDEWRSSPHDEGIIVRCVAPISDRSGS